jgi:hypothetical protein
MQLKHAVLAAAVAAATVAPAFAEWRPIAQREVTDRTETDTITLPGDRSFERLRFCVGRNPVHFVDVDVHFANGGHQDVSIASRIAPGDCTRAIDLEGGRRNISRIVLRYEEDSRRTANAVVRVFGD